MEACCALRVQAACFRSGLGRIAVSLDQCVEAEVVAHAQWFQRCSENTGAVRPRKCPAAAPASAPAEPRLRASPSAAACLTHHKISRLHDCVSVSVTATASPPSPTSDERNPISTMATADSAAGTAPLDPDDTGRCLLTHSPAAAQEALSRGLPIRRQSLSSTNFE